MEVSIPYKFKPRDYQLPLLKFFDTKDRYDQDGRIIGKRAVVVWHRRAGKDKTALNIVVKEAFRRRGTYFYFFPELKQGRKILWDGMDRDGFKFIDHIPKELVFKKNDTEMKIELTNGSIIQIVGSDSIDSIVGTNPVGCVFSEYSVQNRDGWDFVRPILAENGGWAMFVYTPRGMNHGWEILQTAKSEVEKGSSNWFYSLLTHNDTNAISLEALEYERQQIPQGLFEQEYLCKFLDGASQFFKNIENCTWSGDLYPRGGGIYTLGVDLAKTNDWTVITPFEHNTFRVGKQDRFNQIDYVLQQTKIEAWHHKFNKANIRLDTTGVGEPIFDNLTSKGFPVDPYTFTPQSRTNLLNNLRILLEEGRVKIPNDPELLTELRSMQYVLTDGGRVKLSVPDGKHDDMIMSLALAVWNVSEPLENPNSAYTSDGDFYRGMDYFA